MISQYMNSGANPSRSPHLDSDLHIVNVWKENLESQVERLASLVNSYNVIAFDTEFPGVHYKPNVNFDQYTLVKKNVDDLAMIQLGLTISNEKGEKPESAHTWQFNFCYSLSKADGKFDPSSIALLQNSGINFAMFEEQGIEWNTFAVEFITSGIVMNKRIKWICFHGCYDFAYFIKTLQNECLPKTHADFQIRMQWYFWNSVDIKLLLHDIESLDSGQGLNRLADQFQVGRVGTAHQAGSDSLVTLDLFFKMISQYYSKDLKYVFSEYTRKIYGFGELEIEDEFQLQNKQYSSSVYSSSQPTDQVSTSHLSHPTTPTLTAQSVAFSYTGASDNQPGFMLGSHSTGFDYSQGGSYMYANNSNPSANSYYPPHAFPPPPVMSSTSLAPGVQMQNNQRFFPASGVKTQQTAEKRLPLLKQTSNPFQSSILVELNAKSSPAFQPSKKFDNEAASLPQMNLPPSNPPRQY